MNDIPAETIRLVREIVEREHLTPADMIKTYGDHPATEVFGACRKTKCSGPLVRPVFNVKSYRCSCLAAWESRYDIAREASESACSGVASDSPNTSLQAYQQACNTSRETTSASTVSAAPGAELPPVAEAIASMCASNSWPQSIADAMSDHLRSVALPSADDHGTGSRE
jgi:hypothetical protein